MTEAFDAADEMFHPGDDPYWKESAWFGFHVPERDMNGFVYFFHDLRTGVSGGGPALWDKSGEETYSCRFYDWRWLQPPVSEPLDYRDFTLANTARQQVREPLHSYRLSYDDLGLSLDLEWTSIMAPHAMRYRDPSVMRGGRHFDQPGRMTGSLVLHGERIAVDCWSLRDRTWGPHRPGASRSGDYLWAIASAQDHWHALVTASEPGIDTVASGYLMRDGVLGELVSGQRRVLERRSGAPARVVLDAVDDRGRALHAEGEVRTALRWFGWPGRMAFWTLTRWGWDGIEANGENQEFFPLDQVRALLRNG